MAPETIGFIGLGVMGKPMAKNLIKAGHQLVVHSRTRASVDEVVAAGAAAAVSPADVARRTTMVITMLPDTADVELVLTGPDGVLPALQPRAIVADMSSISPVATKRLAALVADRGGSMLDAPVSGGEIGAINASLSIMVGGDEAAFARARPVFEAMGTAERIVLIGASGAGQVCKICNQVALLGGFAASRVLEVHGERMLNANYKPGFRTKLYQKDLRLANEAASANGVAMPGTALVAQLVNALVASGGGDLDYAAMGTVLFELAGVK